MFERSLLEQSTPAGRGWRRFRAVLFSVATQIVVCVCVFLIPLLHPQRLPAVHAETITATLAPKPIPPPVKPQPIKQSPLQVTRQSTAMAAPQPEPILMTHRGGMATHAPGPTPDAPPLLALGGGMSDSFSTGIGLGGLAGTAPHPSVRAATPALAARPGPPLNVSKGVIAGLLLAPIRPSYPAIAISAHIQGTVELTATIDKTGRIVNLAVVSGPAMLRGAAVDAVSAARYKPYLLNGEPTEVTTTISVIFRLGGG